jgi:hypothetical protein
MNFLDYKNFQDFCKKNNYTTEDALKFLEIEGKKRGWI